VAARAGLLWPEPVSCNRFSYLSSEDARPLFLEVKGRRWQKTELPKGPVGANLGRPLIRCAMLLWVLDIATAVYEMGITLAQIAGIFEWLQAVWWVRTSHPLPKACLMSASSDQTPAFAGSDSAGLQGTGFG